MTFDAFLKGLLVRKTHVSVQLHPLLNAAISRLVKIQAALRHFRLRSVQLGVGFICLSLSGFQRVAIVKLLLKFLQAASVLTEALIVRHLVHTLHTVSKLSVG